MQISELNTLRSHIRVIHNIKDGPYLKLKCCNNQGNCEKAFLSYSAFTKHMIDCVNKPGSINDQNIEPNIDAINCTKFSNSNSTDFSVVSNFDSPISKSVFSRSINDSSNVSRHPNKIDDIKNANVSNAQISVNIISKDKSAKDKDALLSNIVNLKLPESTTNAIISSFTSYINSTSDTLKNFVLSNEFSNPPLCKALVDNINDLKNPFADIATTHLRNKKLESGPGFVKATRIVVNRQFKPTLHISRLYVKKPKQICFAYIPILQTLELVLRHEEVRIFLSKTHVNDPGVYRSPSDGSVVQNSEFYKNHPKALKIILYFDEYETVNALGSKTGRHKMGGLYMTLANLPFHINSKLKAIFLVAKFNCKDLKNGRISFRDILKPVFEDVRRLEQGIKLNDELHHGSILTISADNLGGNSIFGFVECFTAIHYCRYCVADIGKCRKMIKEDPKLIRNLKQYERHYQEFIVEKATNKKLTHKIGVKNVCLLSGLYYFDMFSAMSFDAMHDILEGVLQYVLKYIGKYMISQKILTLDEINARIESFDYGPINQSDKPSTFKVTKKGHLINQRACQAWCLLSVFPLMFADVMTTIHKPKFKLITTLVEIARIVFSPVINTSMIKSLQSLIEVHHRIVINHFQIALPAKFHFLIHYPKMIERLGPPVYYWCMRFEGKHNFFVDIINKIKNYKSLCMTLSKRHQIIFYNFWGKSQSELNEFSFGKQKLIIPPSGITNHFKNDNYLLNGINTMSFLNFNSIKFAVGYFLIEKVIENIVHFNEILYVFKHENEFKFITRCWNTSNYNSVYSAYQVNSTDEYKILHFKNLKYFETFNKLQNYNKSDWYIVTKRQYL